jgi:hypothetical protein
MNEITRNPLCWPDSVPRKPSYLRGSPHFKTRTLYDAAGFVFDEIDRLNNIARGRTMREHVIISCNLRLKSDGSPYSGQREPDDSGIAVYFELRLNRNGKRFERPIVMSCDKWRLTADNLYAIGKDIEAQRARTRWGCTNYEQSFRGYMALPEKCGGASWWDQLGIDPAAAEQVIKDRFRLLSKTAHPDVGGSRVEWDKLQNAYDQAMARFR